MCRSSIIPVFFGIACLEQTRFGLGWQPTPTVTASYIVRQSATIESTCQSTSFGGLVDSIREKSIEKSRYPEFSTLEIDQATPTTNISNPVGWSSPSLISGPRIPPKRLDLTYASCMKALRHYYELHSHLILPRRFIVPKKVGYPLECQGTDLASTVYNMNWWRQHVKNNPDRVTELNQMGFVWERLQPEWNLILQAIITYKSMHDHLLVPSTFVVPTNDTRWPIPTRKIPLGRYVHRIRGRSDFLRGDNALGRWEQLDALGFVWDLEGYRFEQFCTALQMYANLEHRRKGKNKSRMFKVPVRYVVPRSKEWPKSLWGYKLGTRCSDVQHKGVYVKGNPQRVKHLAKIGLSLEGKASFNWSRVLQAAKIYSRLHGGKLNVPQQFKVPHPPNHADPATATGDDGTWPWPEKLWGLPLGMRLSRIRLSGHYLRGDQATVRRRQLDKLGFNWNPTRGRRLA